MTQAIRYRTGTDARTGKILRGWPHCVQSLNKIWMTRKKTRIMRLDFGSDLHLRLGEDITPALALQIYADLRTAAHTHEPEYRITEMQLVHLTKAGALGLRHRGTFYPEGRLGNYEIAQGVSAVSPLRSYFKEARAA